MTTSTHTLMASLLCLLLLALQTTASIPNIPQCEPEVLSSQVVIETTAGIKGFHFAELDGNAAAVDVVYGAKPDLFSTEELWFKPGLPSGEFGPRVYVSNIGFTVTLRVLTSADVDNDGDNDVLYLTSGTGYLVGLVTNGGSGSFSGPVYIGGTGNTYTMFTLLDANEDGWLDLVVGDDAVDQLLLVLATGGGAFSSTRTPFAPGNFPTHASALDADADGHMDVLVYLLNSQRIELHYGDGNGGFPATTVVLSSISFAAPPVAADINGDGWTDVITSGSSRVRLFLGSGPRTFAPSTILVNGGGTPKLMDWDGDGDLDLVLSDGATTVRYNLGLGASFAPPLLILESGPGLEVLDLFGTGETSLAYGTESELGLVDPGRAIFGSGESIAEEIKVFGSFTTGDYDRDGDDDIFLGATPRALLVNTGGARFDLPIVVDTVSGSADGLLSMDVDGDGDLDVLAWKKSDTDLQLHENLDGKGTFAPAVPFLTPVCPNPFASCTIEGVTVGFVNADNTPDLVIISNGASTNREIRWWPNVNDTFFDPPNFVVTLFTVLSDVMILADVDNDNDNDLCYVDGFDIAVATNLDGQGTSWSLADVIGYGITSFQTMALQDQNGDGNLDVLLVYSVSADARWYAGNGDGTFSGSFTPVSGLQGTEVRLVDVDADGDLDAVSLSSSELAWVPNLGPFAYGPKTVISSLSSGADIAAKDFDRDGDIDFVTASTGDELIRYFPRLARTPFTPPVATNRSLAYDSLLCANAGVVPGFDPYTTIVPSLCLLESIARASRCVPDTIMLPPGTYECFRGRHLTVAWSVRLKAKVPGSVLFHCQPNSVLFRVASGTVGVTPAVELSGVRIKGASFSALEATAVPGLRVEGAGSSLTLQDVTVSQGVSQSSASLLAGGVGGCLLATTGGTISLFSSIVTGCSASNDGGGVAALGVGSSVLLAENSLVEGNTAGGSGGGLAALFGGAIYVSNGSVIASNVAGQVGGGIWVETGTHSSLQVNNGTFAFNSATVGGGMAVALSDSTLASVSSVEALPSAPPNADPGGSSNTSIPSVILRHVSVLDNQASTWGGGLYACASRIVLSGESSVWTRNRAGVGKGGDTPLDTPSSGDVFVCRPDAMDLADFAPDRATPEGLPWLRVAPSLFDAFTSSGWKLHGPIESLDWVTLPPVAIEAGLAISGLSVSAVDILGTPGVVYRSSLVSFAVKPGEVSARVAGADTLVHQPVVSLPALTPVVTNVATLPGEVELVVGLAGSAASLSAFVQIELCGVGKGGVTDQDRFSCALCSPGTGSSTVSADPCLPFPECPANTFRSSSTAGGGDDSLNSTSTLFVDVSTCVCVPGFWTPTGETDVPCSLCPRGASCTGGVERPVALPGFSPATGEGAVFLPCPNPEACTGAAQCSVGYEGRLCARCANGYYQSGADCLSCPSAPYLGLALMVVTLVASSLAFAGFILFRLAPRTSVAREVPSLRTRTMPGTLSIVYIGLQLLGVLGGIEFGFGSNGRSALSVFGVANFSLDVTASGCALSSDSDRWVILLIISLTLPIVFLTCAIVFAILLRLVWTRVSPVSLSRFVEAVVLGAGPLVYIPMTQSSLSIFGCAREDTGRWYLLADPARTCFDSAWNSGLLPLGMTGVVIYVAGIPGFLFFRLWHSRSSLHAADTIARLGSLYKLYRLEYWWAELLALGQRLAVVLVSIVLAGQPLLQIGGLIACLAVVMVARARLQPYYFELYNRADLAINACVASVLLVGAGTYARSGAAASDDSLFPALIVALVAFAVSAVVAIGADALQIRQERRIGPGWGIQKRTNLLVSAMLKESPDLSSTQQAVINATIEQLHVDCEGGDPLDHPLEESCFEENGLAMFDLDDV